MSRQHAVVHAAFARGKDENWAEIDDAQKRKRVQNRLAQRSYRHKIRERLQELEHLKTVDQGNSTLLGDHSTQASNQASNQGPTQASNQASTQASNKVAARSASPVHHNVDVLVKTTTIAPTVPPLAFPMFSESSESSGFSEHAPFIPRFSDSPFSPLASPDKGGEEASSIDDFLIGLCSSDDTEADTILKSAVGSSQLWTAPSLETADYGFELFGPSNPPAAFAQSTELKFTELMLKIRDIGFADMESMILEYYSTQFSRESLPYWLQRRSRQQKLHGLLEQLDIDSCSWPAQERASFEEGIKRIADRVFSTEHSSSDFLLSFPFPIDNSLL